MCVKKTVKDNQRGIFCDCCSQWVHLKCTCFSTNEYKLFSNSSDSWYCQQCLQAAFPFNHFDDDLDFLSCIFIQNRCDNPKNPPIRNSAQLQVLSEFAAIDKDIDPDKNLLCFNKNVSYYTEAELNRFVGENKSRNYNSKMSVLHINARSINKNFDNVMLLINSIKITFKVIAISETWIDDKHNQVLPQIPGYTCFSKPRTERKGGGLALYIQDTLKSLLINLDGHPKPNTFECLAVDLPDSQMRVGVIYRPPDTDMHQFNDEYDKFIHAISYSKKKMILAGDFNINLFNCDTHDATDKFLENSHSHFLHPTITRPTRFCQTTSTLIDNIFVNSLATGYLSGIIISAFLKISVLNYTLPHVTIMYSYAG